MLQGHGVHAEAAPLDLQQGVLEGLQVLGFFEQGDQHHPLQPVHGELLQAWPAAATAMEQASGFRGRVSQGSEQVGVQGSEGVWGHR